MPRLARNTPHATRRLSVNCKILPELRGALLDAAEANGRTLAAEVEARLAASLAGQDQRAMMREVVTEVLDERDARTAGEAWHRAAGSQRGTVIHTGRTIGG